MKKLFLVLSISIVASSVIEAGFLDTLKSAASSVKNTLTGAAAKATAEVQGIITDAQNKITDITNTINNIVNDIKGFITGLTTEIQEVIATITGSVDEIKNTSITKKDGNPIDTLVDSIKKIPQSVQAASEKPLADLIAATTSFENDINTNVSTFGSNITSSINAMKTGINTAGNYLKAGDIQNGIPQLVDTFGTSVTNMVSTMTGTFAQFGTMLQATTSNLTKAIQDLVNNTMGVDWQSTAQAGVAIAEDITKIFESVHSAVNELNHAVDTIGQKSLKLAGDFTDTTSAQSALNTLTGQEDGQIKIILDDIQTVEDKITSALQDILTYIEKTQPAVPVQPQPVTIGVATPA